MPMPLVWFGFVLVVAFTAGVAAIALSVDIRCWRTSRRSWMPRRADYCHVCGTEFGRA